LTSPTCPPICRLPFKTRRIDLYAGSPSATTLIIPHSPSGPTLSFTPLRMDSAACSSSQLRPLPLRPPAAFRPASSYSKRKSAHSSVFLSRLPEDPFSSSAFLQRDPIVVNSEHLFHASINSHPTRDVILVLGGQ